MGRDHIGVDYVDMEKWWQHYEDRDPTTLSFNNVADLTAIAEYGKDHGEDWAQDAAAMIDDWLDPSPYADQDYEERRNELQQHSAYDALRTRNHDAISDGLHYIDDAEKYRWLESLFAAKELDYLL